MCLHCFSYLCLIICNLRPTSFITYFFYSCIFFFSPWNFWLVNYITVSADLLALVIRNFSCVIGFSLIALRTHAFPNRFFSGPASISCLICLVQFDISCLYPTGVVVVAVASNASNALGKSFSISLYSFIVQSFYTNSLLVMIITFSKNDTLTKLQIQYLIKNPQTLGI